MHQKIIRKPNNTNKDDTTLLASSQTREHKQDDDEKGTKHINKNDHDQSFQALDSPRSVSSSSDIELGDVNIKDSVSDGENDIDSDSDNDNATNYYSNISSNKESPYKPIRGTVAGKLHYICC